MSLPKETMEILEAVAPELRESENERTRNEIIAFIEQAIHRGGGTPIPKEKEAKWLAYLERQKEQKSLNISAASEWLREHVCAYMNSEYNEFHKCVEYDGSIDKERLINDFEEAMQKEQKPIEDVVKDITKNKESATKFLKSAGIMDDNGELAEMYRSEQKPAEWSEEDKKILHGIEQCVYENVANIGTVNKVKYVDWLKSLRPQQKPVKLDDDTEVGLDRALQIVKAAKGTLCGYQSDDGIYECCHAIQTLERILKN